MLFIYKLQRSLQSTKLGLIPALSGIGVLSHKLLLLNHLPVSSFFLFPFQALHEKMNNNLREDPGTVEWKREEANGSSTIVPSESGTIMNRAFFKAWSFLKKAWELGVDDPRKVIHCLKVGAALTIVSLFYYMRPLYEGLGGTSMWAIMTVVVIFEYTVGKDQQMPKCFKHLKERTC